MPVFWTILLAITIHAFVSSLTLTITKKSMFLIAFSTSMNWLSSTTSICTLPAVASIDRLGRINYLDVRDIIWKNKLLLLISSLWYCHAWSRYNLIWCSLLWYCCGICGLRYWNELLWYCCVLGGLGCWGNLLWYCCALGGLRCRGNLLWYCCALVGLRYWHSRWLSLYVLSNLSLHSWSWNCVIWGYGIRHGVVSNHNIRKRRI